VSETRSFVFFGEDVFSLVVLKSLIEGPLDLRPLATVMLAPHSVSGRRLIKYCESRGVAIIETHSIRSEDFLRQLDELDYDLIVSAHFQRILPARVFSRARIGALNLHPSLLPKYRGMSPQHWPIIMGDAETGVTVHRIDDGVDTGRIMRQVRIPLDPEIYIHQLHAKFLEIYRTIMIEAVQRILAGELGEEQPEAGISYFHKIQESDMEIGAEMDVARAYSLVRAFSFPYTGARFGSTIILKAKPVDEELRKELLISANSSGLLQRGTGKYLMLKDGALELIKWRII